MSSGVGNRPSRKKKNCKSPGMSGGGGLQVKLLNAVFGQGDPGVLFSHGRFLGINPIGPSKEQISSKGIREFSSPVDTFWV